MAQNQHSPREFAEIVIRGKTEAAARLLDTAIDRLVGLRPNPNDPISRAGIELKVITNSISDILESLMADQDNYFNEKYSEIKFDENTTEIKSN